MGSLNTGPMATARIPHEKYEGYMSKLPIKSKVVVDAEKRQIRCEICNEYMPMSAIRNVEVSQATKILRDFSRCHTKCAQEQQSYERKRSEAKRGNHQKHDLMIIDESGDIPKEIWDKACVPKLVINQKNSPYTTNRLEKILQKRVDTKDTTD